MTEVRAASPTRPFGRPLRSLPQKRRSILPSRGLGAAANAAARQRRLQASNVEPLDVRKASRRYAEVSRLFSGEAGPVSAVLTSLSVRDTRECTIEEAGLEEDDDDEGKKRKRRIPEERRPLPPLLLEGTPTSRFCSRLREFGRRDAWTPYDGPLRPTTATTVYLKRCSELSLLPEPSIGKVLADAAKHLCLPHMLIGDAVAESLSDSLTLIQLASVDLRDNRIGLAGAVAVSKGLAGCSRLEALDLSANKLGGHAGAVALSSALSCIRGTLRILSLENCGLHGRSLVCLLEAFRKGSGLKRLNLSQNEVEVTAATSLRKFLQQSTLLELELRWTKLRGKAAALICQGLQASTVRTADLSWNAWGGSEEDDSALSAMATLMRVKNPRGLTHLDLSHSRVTRPADVKVLSNALSANDATLLGLHMGGNAAACDAHGFLVKEAKKELISPLNSAHHVFSRIIGGKASKVPGEDWGASARCWICERWVEHRFVYVADSASSPSCSLSHDPSSIRCSLRASFDGFNPKPMKRLPDNTFELWRMTPPGKTHYAFQVDFLSFEEEEEEQAEEEPVVMTRRPSIKTMAPAASERRPSVRRRPSNEIVFLKPLARRSSVALTVKEEQGPSRRISMTCVAADQLKTQMTPTTMLMMLPIVIEDVVVRKNALKEVNTLELEPKPADVALPTTTTKPRNIEAHDEIKEADEDDELSCSSSSSSEAAAWEVGYSIFRSYKSDNERTLTECFEADFALGSLGSKVDEATVETLRANYGSLKAVFKQYALLGSGQETTSLGWNAYSELCSSLGLSGCRGGVMRADVDMVFFGSALLGPKGVRNPPKMLCRFQFLDAIVKVALKRWAPQDEALRRLLEALKSLPSVEFDAEAFHQRFWTEETDDLVTLKLEAIQSSYLRFSSVNKPGEPRMVSIQQWLNFNASCGLNAHVTDRELKLAFGRSLMTVTDEMKTDKHRSMDFAEFMEALLRVADSFEDSTPTDALRVVLEAVSASEFTAVAASGSPSSPRNCRGRLKSLDRGPSYRPTNTPVTRRHSIAAPPSPGRRPSKEPQPPSPGRTRSL